MMVLSFASRKASPSTNLANTRKSSTTNGGRHMNRMLLEGERKALQSRLDVLNRVESNCHTCIKMEQSGYCQQHKSHVPDDFKSTGGDEWERDDIPV